MKNILLGAACALALTGCSSGKDKVQEVFKNGEIYSYEEAPEVFEVQSIKIIEDENKSESVPEVGTFKYYIATVEAVLKVKKDCELQTYFLDPSKKAIPPCSAIDKKLAERKKREAEIKEMKQMCIGGQCANVSPSALENHKAYLRKENTNATSFNEKDVVKAGSYLTFKVRVVVSKSPDGDGKWKLFSMQNLDSK